MKNKKSEKKEVEQVSRDLIEAKNLIKSKPSPSKKVQQTDL